MSVELTVGHSLDLALSFLDAAGNPMLSKVTLDSPAVWTNTTPATETLTVDPTGLTASAGKPAVGTDVVTVTAIVGGVTFSATLAVTVDSAPQVLTSVAITPTVT